MEKIKTWLHKPKKDAEEGTGPWTSGAGSHQTGTVAKETPQRETAPGEAAEAAEAESWRAPTWSPRLPLRAVPNAGCEASLPSSPALGPGLRRLGRSACSLPASPLLGGGGASRSTAAVSRLWVEAALQRSKKTRGLRSPPAHDSQKGRGAEEWSDEEEEEEEELLCADGDRWRYCLLTPCLCLRCPSAPPLEDQYVSAESSGWAPSEAWRLYPSLSAWTASAHAPRQPSGGQQEDALRSCLHGNSGEEPRARARPAESCGFCSDDFSVKVSPRQGGSCGSQVVCCHCVSRLVSFLQVQQRSQPAGL